MEPRLPKASVHFVDIRMVDPVGEAYRGRLVRIVDGQLDVDLPNSAFVRTCTAASAPPASAAESGDTIGVQCTARDVLSFGP